VFRAIPGIQGDETWVAMATIVLFYASPEHGIAPGTPWADVPMNWTCPECGARKEDFEMVPV
jgi:rubrerythrin